METINFKEEALLLYPEAKVATVGKSEEQLLEIIHSCNEAVREDRGAVVEGVYLPYGVLLEYMDYVASLVQKIRRGK